MGGGCKHLSPFKPPLNDVEVVGRVDVTSVLGDAIGSIFEAREVLLGKGSRNGPTALALDSELR